MNKIKDIIIIILFFLFVLGIFYLTFLTIDVAFKRKDFCIENGFKDFNSEKYCYDDYKISDKWVECPDRKCRWHEDRRIVEVFNE